MARWLIDKTKFYTPCPECGYAFGEMYENYIKGSANRIHYFFKCRKCNCFIETRKKNKLMEVYLRKRGECHED